MITMKRAAALLLVAAGAGGGAFAVTNAATGSPAPAAQSVPTARSLPATGTATASSQAAVLRDVLASPGRRLGRLRLLGGMYGQFTFHAKGGARTLAFERGTVTAVTGDDVVVRAKNGTTYTWELTGTSVVREDGAREATSALASGQTVFAAGPVTGSTRDARLVVIRTAAKTSTGA